MKFMLVNFQRQNYTDAADRAKRLRDDSDPWNVAWSPDKHRRLEVLGDSKVVINWMNGEWEVKGDEHAVHVREVADQLARRHNQVVLFGRETTRPAGADIFRE